MAEGSATTSEPGARAGGHSDRGRRWAGEERGDGQCACRETVVDRGGSSEFVLRPVTLAIRRWEGRSPPLEAEAGGCRADAQQRHELAADGRARCGSRGRTRPDPKARMQDGERGAGADGIGADVEAIALRAHARGWRRDAT